MSDAGGFSIQDLLENVLDENVLNENVLENVFDENVENDNFDFDFGFNTNFTFILDDKKNDDNSLLYKNHDIRTQPYEGFDMQIDTMENSKISNKTCCVEDTDNLSDLNDTDCCFHIDTQQQVSGGKIVKTVKKKTKKKRKHVDVKEQPKKKTRNTPFEAGSNIQKLEDMSVYKIKNIYQDVGEHDGGVWKADVEQVFPAGPSCTIVIDKDKYVHFNTIF